MRPHFTRLAAASLAMALLLSACSDTDTNTNTNANEDSRRSQGSTETAGESWPSLELSTSFEVPEVGRAITPAVRTHEDLVIVAGEQRILALDEHGEQQWAFAPRGRWKRICHASETINADGLVALRLGTSEEDGCEATAALDVTDGTLRWNQQFELSRWRNTDDRVSISDTTVHSSGECGEVMRYATSDGKPLPSLAPSDAACAHDSWHDSSTVSLVIDPIHDTDVDSGTGWVHDSGEGEIQIEQWDATTRKRLWSRSAPNGAAQLTRVVSHEPEVWLAEDRGHTHLWLVDRGRFTTPLSPGIGWGDDTPAQGSMADGLFVAHYEDGVTRAFDPDTGEEFDNPWASDAMGSSFFLGIHDDRILGIATGNDPETGGLVSWLQTRSVRDPADVVTLGMLPFVGHRISGHELDGDQLRLLLPPEAPERGGDRSRVWTVHLPEGRAGDPSRDDDQDDSSSRLRYDEDDAVRACRAISARTLRLIKMPRPGLPAPLDCTWTDMVGTDGLVRRLRVTAMARVGLSQDEADRSTREALDQRRSELDGRWKRLDGPADEAWLQHATRPADDTFPSRSEARILARHGNVEIDVDVLIRPEEGDADMSPQQDAVVRAAEAALADVVAGLDADD